MRTTSWLESMNAVLRRLSPTHPIFFKFVNCIRMHEFSKSVDLWEMMKSDAPNRGRKRKKVERLDAKIEHLTMALKENAEMTPELFLEELATEPVLPETGKKSIEK